MLSVHGESSFSSVTYGEVAVLLSDKDNVSTKRPTIAILNSTKTCNTLLVLSEFVTMIVRHGRCEKWMRHSYLYYNI